MQITRLTLANFRVFAEADLELPPGVVGIYGPNGSGKSTLVEAVLWALFGVARTAKEGVRRDGAEGECRVSVGFEHEGHHYEIVRSLAGAAHTVRAEVSCDGIRLATGATAVRQYVHQVLGMSADAFRSSVFCEQKHLDAFSARRPEERRRLVLDLLGITPIDRARDSARSTARALLERVETARLVLGDLDVAAAEVSALEQEAAGAAVVRGDAEAALSRAEADLAGAEAAAVEAQARKVERDRLAAAWNEARRRSTETGERLAALEAEQAGLDQAASRLAALEDGGSASGSSPGGSSLAPGGSSLAPGGSSLAPGGSSLAARLEAARARLGGLLELRVAIDGHTVAVEAAAAAGPVVDLAALDEAASDAERRSGEAAGRLAGLEGAVAAARNRCHDARSERDALGGLDRTAPCPTCGQSLAGGAGGCFDELLARRDVAVTEADGALAAVGAEQTGARAALTEAQGRAAAATTTRGAARRDADQAADLRAAAAAAADRLGRLRVALGTAAPGEFEALGAAVARLEAERDEAVRLAERLSRRGALAERAAAERIALAAVTESAASLLAEGRALGFDSSAHDAVLAVRATAGGAVESARRAALEASLHERGLTGRLAEKRARLESELGRRAELAGLEVDARHQGRLAELLTEFRNSLVGEVGPALSAQTTALFRELTDGRFDRLEVDGDTFELRVSSGGADHSLERHSGSETDLANLSLRVAIAEQVSLLSGGQVGLLVLDEVVGALDGEHRERLVEAVGRLGARFRQVILVTHSAEIKEQLPNAVEVVPVTRCHSEARLSTAPTPVAVTSASPERTRSVVVAKYF